jgi:hypothetical protein
MRVEVTSQAILIWLGLVGAGIAILALFGWLARSQHLGDEGRLSKSDHDELETVAATILDKAQQAAIAADLAESGLAEAEVEREKAWQAHTTAVAALEKAKAEAQAAPVEVMSSQEQREVSKAARDAFRRGELTEEELRAVWQKVDGWDQAVQQRASELSRLRVEVAEAWRRYHLASSAERMVRQRVEIAQVAARALKQEATEAAREAELAKKKRR